MKKNLILTGWYYPEYLAAAAAVYGHYKGEAGRVISSNHAEWSGDSPLRLCLLNGNDDLARWFKVMA